MRPGLIPLCIVAIGTLGLAACGCSDTTVNVLGTADLEVDAERPNDSRVGEGPEGEGPERDGPERDGSVGDTGPDMGPGDPGTCAGAHRVTLSGGKATVSGDITGLTDEFSTLECQATGAESAVTMKGPQAYYKFAATKDKWYRFTLEPEFGAYLYVFTSATCTEPDIARDCTSGGATGEASYAVPAGETRVVHFKAPATGDVYFAVDSTRATAKGTFSVTIEEITSPQNGTCAQAEKLTFVGGKAAVEGSTGATLTPDEFRTLKCGTYLALDGPQVYYSFDAQADKAYEITLISTSAEFLYAYVFGSSCVEAEIEADCASGGSSGIVFDRSVKWGDNWKMTFVPDTPGPYTVAVDSRLGAASGGFTLEIAELTAPSNGVCTLAQTIPMSGGRGTVAGTTRGGLDEFSTLACMGTGQYGTTKMMDGPQVYYTFAATQGNWYRITLDPRFEAYMYVFTNANCTLAGIQTDCQSQGLTGETSSKVSALYPETIYFKAPVTADVFVAVDSTAYWDFGDFTLSIDEMPQPQNGTCSNAATLTLSGGKARVQGDVSPAFTPDEFAALKCQGSGIPITTFSLSGPQAYYRFLTQSGQWYRITLDPTFIAYLYAFTDAACTEAAIAADCQSQGATGEASYSISIASPETIHFRAPATGEIYVGVDSDTNASYGTFFLDIDAIPQPTNTKCSSATPLTFSGGRASAEGELGVNLTPDEFPTLRCTYFALDGPQVYYSFVASAGKTYDITVTAESANFVYFYVFGASCSESDIQADCSSDGSTGDESSSSVSSGSSQTLSFVAPSSGTHHIGVEKPGAAGYGTFRLTVQEK